MKIQNHHPLYFNLTLFLTLLNKTTDHNPAPNALITTPITPLVLKTSRITLLLPYPVNLDVSLNNFATFS